MYEMYEDLNDDAKEYFLLLLDDKVKDSELLKRCKIEVNILYDKGLLFIIEYLHRYKMNNKEVEYYFRGTINNILLLYVLDLNKVNPIKYNLPYELFTDNTLSIDFTNDTYLCFVDYLEESETPFRIIKGSFERENIEEINKLEDNHYLIIPKYYQPKDLTFRLNELCHFETVEDYRLLKDKYLTIRLDDKKFIFEKDVDIRYALHSEFEEKVSKQLKPKTIEDYAKIISLAHSTHVWNYNQEVLFNIGKIDINNIIATREDIYEYLLAHTIDVDVILNIIKYLRTARNKMSNELWKKYMDVMKEQNCDEMIIEILSNIQYISGRGQAISECLFAIDENNYYDEETFDAIHIIY